ncbi:MAG: bifunctional methylenetetrahydrofolate dehydrogenase/methenyltetrahydrofolate cyclohydrolase FolD [Chloroflexi bacterium]|nr:bifunctional methylenetetrahydrofolate dehydrogenase/methenyltetrahydrofolate cyclohydrolase FolD [Chloroflexota bacterium]
MTAKIIDGTAIAQQVRDEVAERVRTLATRGVEPGLAVVLVGENPASVSYVRGKTRDAAAVGMRSETIRVPADVSQEELLRLVNELNENPGWHGVLVQLPLPDHIDERSITEAVMPEKDVDGLHPVNVGRLFRGEPGFLSCTPHGVIQMLLRSGHDPAGKHAVVCGRSNLVGKPLAGLLMQKRRGGNATVTVCHTGTPDIATYTRQADILIAVMGRPGTIAADMVREGAVVIDVGVNAIPDATKKSGQRLVGDVDFDSVAQKAAAITPVPGGVGPMTRAMLLWNTVLAASGGPESLDR